MNSEHVDLWDHDEDYYHDDYGGHVGGANDDNILHLKLTYSLVRAEKMSLGILKVLMSSTKDVAIGFSQKW